MTLNNLLGGRHPIQTWHGDIENHHPGPTRFQEFAEPQPISRFPHDLQARLMFQETLQGLPEKMMVIRQDDFVGGRLRYCPGGFLVPAWPTLRFHD